MIYAMQGINGGCIKVGCSNDPAKRLVELQTGSPHKLVILGVVAAPDEAERNIHRYLGKGWHSDWSHGEWFYPTKDVIDALESAGLIERRLIVTPVTRSNADRQRDYRDRKKSH